MRTRIDDPADARLDDIRDLKHSDAREGLVYAEGPLICGRLVESRFPVRCVVGFGGRLDSFLAEHGEQLAAGIPVYEVSRPVLAEVAGYDMHRGLLAVADRPAPMSVGDVIAGARTLLILEGVGDHENIGSMFRNAAGMGVDGVLFGAGTADPLYRRSVRVSMGHALRMPFAHLPGTVTTCSAPWTSCGTPVGGSSRSPRRRRPSISPTLSWMPPARPGRRWRYSWEGRGLG